MINAIGIYIGGSKIGSVPQQLGAVVHIEDFTTPVNGYWVDKSGKNKQIQAATTTALNDSLIMPANDADIIAAVTMAGYYSKFYTTNSTPKTVLLSQIPSIDPKYSFFYDAKNKAKLTLFKTQGDEARADKMYEYTFKAYTGGYFPITQTSDSISFVIRGTGTYIFDWGDGTTTSYTLSTTADTTVSKTWTTNLGGQKNISVTGIVKNWTKFNQISKTVDNEIIRITGIALTYLQLNNCPNVNIFGAITGMQLSLLQLINCPNVNITGVITGMALTFLQLINCPNINITGSITGMALTVLSLANCPNINITGSITGMALVFLQLYSCPNINITGSIETCEVTITTIDIRLTGITYGGGATKAWNISQTVQAGWTETMLDAYINAYASTAPVSLAGKVLNWGGSNAAPTSASLTSRNYLISIGASIIVNS